MDAQERTDAGQIPESNSPQSTPNDQTSQTLQGWWDAASFPEKEFLNLEGCRLSLKATAYFVERQIAILQTENADQTLQELRDKYTEAKQRVDKLSEDWQNAEEVLKLQSRVRSLRDYLSHLQAAGNLSPLFKQLEGWEKEIKDRLGANGQQREALVIKAEELSDSTQWKETAQQFRELEEKWRQAPSIDKAESDAMRQRLDAAKDKFFERRRQHQEELEKDMAQSLDLKLEIVEKAERLAKSEEWKSATESFRELMEQWKQTGKTFSDKQEELWQRFQDAKTAFFERKRMHHQEIQSEQEENYEKKLALVVLAEELQQRTNWTATAKEFERIQQEWNKTGRVPQEKSDALWQRLHKAKDTFYGNRRQHNEQLMGQLQENLTKKQELIRQAEEISRSTNWREGTEEMNELMAQWKKTGPAPRELNEKVWEQFLAARKYFFERKDANREQHKARISQQYDRRLHQTQNFLATLQNELKEEEDNLADFRESLSKLTSGPKEEELRRHLKNLISQSEKNLERRHRKIEEVHEQLKTLQSRPEKTHDRMPTQARPHTEVAAENSSDLKQQQTSAQEENTKEEAPADKNAVSANLGAAIPQEGTAIDHTDAPTASQNKDQTNDTPESGTAE